MPKASHKKRNGASQAGTPYSQAVAKTKAAHNIFRMNTDIGQHVLVNPLCCKTIVEKAELKQGDVSGVVYIYIFCFDAQLILISTCRRCLKLGQVREI